MGLLPHAETTGVKRLQADKRGEKSLAKTLDRVLHERDSDWWTNAGSLTTAEAATLELKGEQGLKEFDTASGPRVIALLEAEEDIREERTTSAEEACERFGTSNE